MDILAVGTLSNFLAAVVIATDIALLQFRQVALLLGALWSVAMAGGAAQLSYREVPGMRSFPILRPLEKSIRAYVATGDKRYLTNSENLSAYPDIDRLATLLDDPSIRKILPASVRSPIAITPEIATGFVGDGVWPAVEREEYAKSWGCFSEMQHAPEKLFRSQPFVTAFPYLRIEVAGQLGKTADVSLETPRHEVTQLAISGKWVDPGWRLGFINVRGTQVRLVAQDKDPSRWIGFREPREIGWLSMAAYRLANRGKLLVRIGIAVLSGCFLLRWLQTAATYQQHETTRG
jgi:hypothetical protein